MWATSRERVNTAKAGIRFWIEQEHRS